MNLSRIQKIGLAFLLASLLPAYLIAHWRYDANLSAIQEKFDREQKLHLSSDKLRANCERNEQKDNAAYDANYQICNQGLQTHEFTAQAMSALEQEKSSNHTWLYGNFLLWVLLLNLLGFVLYKARLLLDQEED
jgi:hypothetical protein